MDGNDKNMIGRSKDAVGDAVGTAAQAVSAAAGEVNLSALRDEIGTIRGQVETMVGDLARVGATQFRKARSGAADGVDVVARKGGEILEEVGHELQVAEDRAAGAVRARPLQAIGLAIGFGFLLALVVRR